MPKLVVQTVDVIQVKQGTRQFLLTRLPAGFVTSVSYAAVRGKDEEEGAIQRVLNTRRITSVRDFTLDGGDFPSALILNWVSKDHPMVRDGSSVRLAQVERAAQIIDGQHRIAGIAAAIEMKPSLAHLQLPVALYSGLTTTECADIFLSINTEQKTVPRSLVFDLFGVASDTIVDHVAVRARDVAMFLHESEESPYEGQIKMPGSPRRRGGIALSTVVSVIKPLVDDKGTFELYDLNELETQKRVILNLFKALVGKYSSDWDSADNVFLYASGFSAAIRFLQVKLLPYCAEKRDFTEKLMSTTLALEPGLFLKQHDLRGLGGVDSINQVYDALVEVFVQPSTGARKIKI